MDGQRTPKHNASTTYYWEGIKTNVCKATEKEDQRLPGKKDRKKEMWTAGFGCSWKKMEMAAENQA